MSVKPEQWLVPPAKEKLTTEEIDQFILWVARTLLFLAENEHEDFIFDQDSAQINTMRAIGAVSADLKFYFETVLGNVGNRKALFIEETGLVGASKIDSETRLDSSDESSYQVLPLAFINFLNQALDQV